MCHSWFGFDSEDGIQKVHLWLQEGQNVMAQRQFRQAGAWWEEEVTVQYYREAHGETPQGTVPGRFKAD